jgi:nucleoside-diphosphate-sugar epimerase
LAIFTKKKSVLVTGGAGYVGAVLIPKLIKKGYVVRVLDLYLFGDHVWPELSTHPNLQEFRGDIRDQTLVREAAKGCDAVIHLACISNDPSFELDPTLGRSINFDSFLPLVKLSKEADVHKFIYASSSSVYGVSESSSVDESHPLLPLTDYSKYKGMCESILNEEASPGFTTVTIRPATVCGYSPRQRLDLTVNILTNHAVHNRKIRVFGGSQMRPNIHIDDITDLYVDLLKMPDEQIAGKIFNAGYENHTVMELAEAIQKVVVKKMPELGPIGIETVPSDDLRSYHISSKKIEEELSFKSKRTIEDAASDLLDAFKAGKLPNPMDDDRYYNIRTMQKTQLAQSVS